MAYEFQDFQEALAKRQSVDAAQALLQNTIEDFGFAQLDYAHGVLRTVAPSRPEDFRMLLYIATVNWTENYLERGYQHVDRGLRASLTSTTPWTYAELFTRKPENALQREMEAEVYQRVSSGLTLPLHGVGSRIGVLYLGSKLSPAEFQRLDREQRPTLALIGAYFSEHIEKLITPNTANVLLTRREIECLRWAGVGKSNWDISMILGIAESTVKEHLQGAMRKLGVTTRTHAVARAISLGLISI